MLIKSCMDAGLMIRSVVFVQLSLVFRTFVHLHFMSTTDVIPHPMKGLRFAIFFPDIESHIMIRD